MVPHPAAVPPARLLLIDDEPLVLSALRRTLGPGYLTLALNGAREALALLARDSGFAAILCDLRMPGMDGRAFYEELRQRHPALARRTVFLSGASELADGTCASEVLPEGRLLEKPFDVARLRALVRELVCGGTAAPGLGTSS